ncbi:hypothetical protein HK099_005165 [Clydaea vesicula]|uniref:DH domain-containing protein n=1 Tax=Clydaea vesicula TaxID=447962 RepID=A0AAD5U203_9FUNG|nr:hypothetical protein HK099_005165 [Clydaea vesicula]
MESPSFSTYEIVDFFEQYVVESGAVHIPNNFNLNDAQTLHHLVVQYLQFSRIDSSDAKITYDDYGGQIRISNRGLRIMDNFIQMKHFGRAAIVIQLFWKRVKARILINILVDFVLTDILAKKLTEKPDWQYEPITLVENSVKKQQASQQIHLLEVPQENKEILTKKLTKVVSNTKPVNLKKHLHRVSVAYQGILAKSDAKPSSKIPSLDERAFMKLLNSEETFKLSSIVQESNFFSETPMVLKSSNSSSFQTFEQYAPKVINWISDVLAIPIPLKTFLPSLLASGDILCKLAVTLYPKIECHLLNKGPEYAIHKIIFFLELCKSLGIKPSLLFSVADLILEDDNDISEENVSKKIKSALTVLRTICAFERQARKKGWKGTPLRIGSSSSNNDPSEKSEPRKTSEKPGQSSKRREKQQFNSIIGEQRVNSIYGYYSEANTTATHLEQNGSQTATNLQQRQSPVSNSSSPPTEYNDNSKNVYEILPSVENSIGLGFDEIINELGSYGLKNKQLQLLQLNEDNLIPPLTAQSNQSSPLDLPDYSYPVQNYSIETNGLDQVLDEGENYDIDNSRSNHAEESDFENGKNITDSFTVDDYYTYEGESVQHSHPFTSNYEVENPVITAQESLEVIKKMKEVEAMEKLDMRNEYIRDFVATEENYIDVMESIAAFLNGIIRRRNRVSKRASAILTNDLTQQDISKYDQENVDLLSLFSVVEDIISTHRNLVQSLEYAVKDNSFLSKVGLQFLNFSDEIMKPYISYCCLLLNPSEGLHKLVEEYKKHLNVDNMENKYKSNFELDEPLFHMLTYKNSFHNISDSGVFEGSKVKGDSMIIKMAWLKVNAIANVIKDKLQI